MRYTTTLILALVVIAAAALIWVYRDDLFGERRPEPEKPAAAKPLIEDLALDDLSEAILQETGPQGALVTKLAVTKTDDTWRLTAPVTGPADDYEVRRLLRGAVEGAYRQTLRPGAKGQPTLADLALAPPAYRLTLTGKAKDEKTGKETEKTVTVDIGRKAAVGGGLYVRLADADQVLMLETDDLLQRARQRLHEYRDRNLVDLERETIVRVTLETPETTLRLDRAEEDAERWVLAEPAARADPDAVSEVLRTAVGLMAAEFVEDGVTDVSPYGLAEPRLVVTLYTQPEKTEKTEKKEDEEKKDEGEKTAAAAEPVQAARLAFGSWADLKQESIYARVGDSDSVVSVEKRDFTKLAKTLSDLRDRHVLALKADRAEEVAVDVPATLAEADQPVRYRLSKRDGTWHVGTKGRDDMKADADAVDDLLAELADLKVLYFAEGENADLAKDFEPVGSVRLRVRKQAAEVGFEFGARAGDVPSLVRNIREDWVGRINEKDLEHLTRDWLQMLDKQVLDLDPDRARRLAIRGPDRTNRFEKTDGAWTMTAPVQADPKVGFVTDRLDDLKDLEAETVLAATDDAAHWNLQEGELAVTVTLEPEKTEPTPQDEAGETKEESKEEKAAEPDAGQPIEHTLILAHHEKAKVVGRVQGRDLIYRLPLSLLKDLASEPLPDEVVEDLYRGDVRRLEVAAGDARVRLVKVDDDWFRTDEAGRPDQEVAKTTVEDVIDAAIDLKAARWAVYEAADPAAFGLETPAVRLTLTDKTDEQTTVLLSAKEVDAKVAALFDESPLRYAMTEGAERIAVVAGKHVETLLDAAETLAPPKPEPEAADEKKPKGNKPAETDAGKTEPPTTQPVK